MMTPDQTRSETFFERHSWKILLTISATMGLFGIGDMVQGMSADPAIAESITGVAWEALQAESPRVANLIDLQVRGGGGHLIVIALLSIVVCVFGFRRGERWAWYTLWALPLWMAFIFLTFWTADRQPDFPPPPPMISAPIFFVVAALALLLPYRKFFPKNE